MSLAQPSRFYAIDDYIRLEQQAAMRHEYHDGTLVDMAGGSPDHSLIIANTSGELRSRLKGAPCRVYDGNLRVRIPDKPFFVYPDVTVICGSPSLDPHDPSRTSVINPRVVVEVLSPSTGDYDRDEKFKLYRMIDSFEEYILIAQDRPSVLTYFRQPGGTWLFTPCEGIHAIASIRSLNIQLPLTEIYAGVEFPPAQRIAAE